MSIGMQMNIRWSIVLNATDCEWHYFQQAISDHCSKSFIYAVVHKFTKFTTIADGENEFDVWARRTKDADIEFIILPAQSKPS